MKSRVLLAVPLVLAAACGSSGNAALSKTFNYGAAQAPTTAEQSAGSSAQTSVTTTASFSSSPTADNGASIAGAALDIAGSALGDAAFGMANPGAVKNALTRAAAAGFDTCATVSAGKVTFNNCVQTEEGFSVTLNGSMTVTANHVSWGLTAGFSGTENGETITISMHHTGDITVTDTKIVGNAASEFSGSVSAGGQSASFGFAVAVLFDLTYQTSPTACVTNGTVEVRRVWTAKPEGASGAEFGDVGVKLIWSGCNTFQVAHSQ
ncbi:MAG: hypothetical protein LC689_15500 [Myxococcales bacterium]|nr:hypothetical protein [Myxococcales bacterium]